MYINIATLCSILIGPDDLTLRIHSYVILTAFHLTLATLSKSFYSCYLSKTRANWCSRACKWQVECTFCAIVLRAIAHKIT